MTPASLRRPHHSLCVRTIPTTIAAASRLCSASGGIRELDLAAFAAGGEEGRRRCSTAIPAWPRTRAPPWMCARRDRRGRGQQGELRRTTCWTPCHRRHHGSRLGERGGHREGGTRSRSPQDPPPSPTTFVPSSATIPAAAEGGRRRRALPPPRPTAAEMTTAGTGSGAGNEPSRLAPLRGELPRITRPPRPNSRSDGQGAPPPRATQEKVEGAWEPGGHPVPSVVTRLCPEVHSTGDALPFTGFATAGSTSRTGWSGLH